MKGIFLFGSGLMLGIMIGLNLRPRKDFFRVLNDPKQIQEDDSIETYIMKKSYHY